MSILNKDISKVHKTITKSCLYILNLRVMYPCSIDGN